ncbi:hypothetical protein EST38_g12718 [Candolleomyces aberdarensis]|uniref:Uncharacterized protein n=1 Tax=Candolleomyces aberdarensis TaxID=2316362 RepID=A0A4Q2D3S5_9AGAR|nr:hypothetical protein EST38_g12718 [Candolleomyces aberdarensis]
MPQPKKHRSQKAKAEANRSKARKSYQKHRDNINERRRALYRQQNPRPSTPPPHTREADPPFDSSQYCIDRMNKIPAQLSDVTGKCPKCFLMQIYSDWLSDYADLPGSLRRVEEPLATVSKIHDSASKWHNMIYSAFGVGPELQEASKILNKVAEVMRWIEEIWIEIVQSPVELIAKHRAGKLLFQAA